MQLHVPNNYKKRKINNKYSVINKKGENKLIKEKIQKKKLFGGMPGWCWLTAKNQNSYLIK